MGFVGRCERAFAERDYRTWRCIDFRIRHMGNSYLLAAMLLCCYVVDDTNGEMTRRGQRQIVATASFGEMAGWACKGIDSVVRGHGSVLLTRGYVMSMIKCDATLGGESRLWLSPGQLSPQNSPCTEWRSEHVEKFYVKLSKI